MSVALIGIAVIQFYWLKNGIDLNTENFDNQVTYALNRVKQHLEEDALNLQNLSRNMAKGEQPSIFKQTEGSLNKILSPNLDNFRRQKYETQIASTILSLQPELALDNISAADLSKYLRVELQNQGISLNYDFGVFSNEIEDYLITNGKYNVVQLVGEASEVGVTENLSQTIHEINLFDGNEPGREAVGSLRVFFPKKTSFLISSILPALISSIFLTGLILFCFVYTINVILTQKKVSLMKTDFINNMTHEFKTPIATISLAADSISNPKVKSNASMIERYADIIRQENKRMLNQVEKVLQIARLDKKDFQLKITSINLHDLVHTVVENSRLRVNNKGGNLDVDIRATLPQIQGDENHISNVLHNLIDNAIKYSGETPEIKISTEDTRFGIKVSVKDNGIGISKEDQKRIFEKFYRVSTGNLHDVKGFGLGLSYVKAIVDSHKGMVQVSSELGKGSIFSVSFPHRQEG